jgi:hypothetical protein
MLTSLISLPPAATARHARLHHLIRQFGLCTCISLDDLFSMHTLPSARQPPSPTGRLYFSADLSPAIADFLIQISSPPPATAPAEPSLSTRRSTFVPLLLADSLAKPPASAFVVADTLETIVSLSEKGVLLCQYLASCLLSYSKALEALSATQSNDQTDGQLRSMIFQVFYLFVEVLARLETTSDQSKRSVMPTFY